MKLDALRAKETSIVSSLLRIAPKRSLIAVAALSISLRRPRANSLDTKILKVHNSDRAKPPIDSTRSNAIYLSNNDHRRTMEKRESDGRTLWRVGPLKIAR